MKSEILAEPILVGRSQELEELLQCLDAVTRGRGTTIFISGEAGSGKTRLSNEFLKIARIKGASVLCGWCLSNSAVPYFPFLESFSSFLSSNEASNKSFVDQYLAANTWLVRQDNPRTFSAQIWQDKTFSVIAKDLLFMSMDAPVILFIDDLHWADSASLSLLHYVSRSTTSERILIVGTFRSEETQNIEGHGRQLNETLRLMGREGLFREIKLSGLNQADVGKIAESMLCGKVNISLAEKIATESLGLPLYVVESLRMLSDQGGIVQKNGRWQLSLKEIGIPDKVKDVILRRLDSLKPDQRRILDAASVIGEQFDPQLVNAAVGQDSLDVLESLETIANSTLLVYCDGDRYRFNHAKSRELLYDKIPLILRREYHSRIAKKIEEDDQFPKERLVSDLAYHYAQTGNKEKLVKYALAAGKEALSSFSNQEALGYFESVLKAISKEPEKDSERTTALEGLGEAYFSNSMFREAAKTFEQLGDITVGVIKLRALRRAMDSAFFQGDFSHLWELTKKAEKFTALNHLESARVLMNRARANTFFGDHNIGSQEFKQALRIFEEENSLSDVARVSLGLGGLNERKEKVGGLAIALRAVTLYDELEDVRGLMDACNRAGQSFGYRLLIKEALDMHEKAVIIGEKIGDFNRVVEAKASGAFFLEIRGDVTKALAMSLKGLEFCQKTDSDWTRGMIYANLVRQYSKLGNIRQAEFYFEKLVKLPETVLFTQNFIHFGLTKALFFACKQQWGECNRFFEESLKSLSSTRAHISSEVWIRTDYAWALKKQNRIEEANNQLQKAQAVFRQLNNYFKHATIQATLIAPRQIIPGTEYSARVDIINVSRSPCKLIALDGLFCQDSTIKILFNVGRFENNSIRLTEINMSSFQVKSIKLSLQAITLGTFTIKPVVYYTDDLGQRKAFEIQPISLSVQSSPTHVEFDNKVDLLKFDPRSEAAKKAFDYLVNAYIEDYLRRKFPPERAGWRTLMDIVKQTRISKHSVYGISGSHGKAVTELKRRGLVEERFFSGERGRGGMILKLKVACNNEGVKRQVLEFSDK